MNELKPRYDSAKSFYKKAKVKQQNGKLILQSYQTDVAEIVNGKPYVKGTYSQTTTRHIKEFLKQQGFKVESTKQMMKDYGRKQGLKGKIKTKSNGGSMMKSVGAIAMLGDIMGGNTLKEKNAWKKRMLSAGLSNRGLSFPDDWDKGVKETEKKKRLNKALRELMK